jgi:hypothetical protein
MEKFEQNDNELVKQGVEKINFEEIKGKIKKMIEVAEDFYFQQIPSFCLTDENENDIQREDNHWSGTLDEIKGKLNRNLTDEEMTLFSLSRCFGPTPSLSDEESKIIGRFIWPNGNNTGIRYDWDDLSEKLSEFISLSAEEQESLIVKK